MTAERLVHADPTADVKRALQRSDRRFIVVRDLATYAPGMEYEPESLEHYGVKFIQGLTDTSPQDRGTVKAILNYAEIYNLLLFRYLWLKGDIIIDGKSGHALPAFKPSSQPHG